MIQIITFIQYTIYKILATGSRWIYRMSFPLGSFIARNIFKRTNKEIEESVKIYLTLSNDRLNGSYTNYAIGLTSSLVSLFLLALVNIIGSLIPNKFIMNIIPVLCSYLGALIVYIMVYILYHFLILRKDRYMLLYIKFDKIESRSKKVILYLVAVAIVIFICILFIWSLKFII